MTTPPLRDASGAPPFELGRGGMGVVELADRRGELVAVKRILPELARSAKARSMFLREARLLAKIDHPNVVRTFAVEPGDESKPPAIVMEFVDGVSLKEAFAASPGGLPVAIAAKIAHDVALGLHAAHELRGEDGASLGVVHRDVSPHNVLVTFGGRVKLLDFGVAKTNDDTRTITGEVKGKIAYMAPEQALADPVDRRSDVYALGALLYEALSGERMHGEGTDLEILRRMATERPKPVGELVAIPDGLAALVDRMTAEKPDDRPATARDVADALAPFAKDADERAIADWLRGAIPDADARHRERLSTMRAAIEPTRAEPAAKTGRWAVLGVAAALAAAVAIVASRGSISPESRTSASPGASVPIASHEPVVEAAPSAPPAPPPIVSASSSPEPPPRRAPSVSPRAPAIEPPVATPSSKPPPAASPAPAVAAPPPIGPKFDPHPF